MKKIFLMFSFILLSATKIFGQAQVDIPLSATDGTLTYPLAVGLDLTATNCIDPQLGESDLPPPSPWGFEIAFDLHPYGCAPLLTYKDYRAPGNPPAFPFTGLVEHTLWWQVLPGLPINITYNLPSGAIMSITDNITGTLLNLGPFTGQGVATIPGSYTSILNKVFLKMDYDSIVPVELISYESSILQNEKAVQLNWTTATETNNSGFEILRFTQNDNEWNSIGFVPGFGTTTEPKSYSFTDENVTTGNYKYRLKQIDFDGSFTYSNEIEVEVDFTPKEFVLYQNYPNPFNPSTTIVFDLPEKSFVTLKLYSITGEEVRTIVNEEMGMGRYHFLIDGNNLSSGVYLLKMMSNNFLSSKKIIMMK